jgi:uncharacterized metal-binding protein
MTPQSLPLSCSNCSSLACTAPSDLAFPKFCVTTEAEGEALASTLEKYIDDPELRKIALVSAGIEGEFYGRLNRVQETIEFIQRMEYQRIGIATCVGLLQETQTFTKILKAYHIDHYVVGCKVGALDKTEIGIPEASKVNGGCGHESMCNPILQAQMLADHNTDFNLVVGLCVGHDSLFLKHSRVPTSVMIVKDRVLAHNPAAALHTAYSGYSPFRQLLQKKRR